MSERSFYDDWQFDMKWNRIEFLRDWEIQSVRMYRSKRGVKAHVVFKLKDDNIWKRWVKKGDKGE